jgi:hypothetical protein
MPIVIDTKKYINKGQSVGFSSYRLGQPKTITPVDFVFQRDRLIYVSKHLGGYWNLPELMLQVTFIQKSEIFRAKKEEAIDILVFTEGLSDVIHLYAIVLTAWVWNKQDSRNRKLSRRNIDIVTAWSAPDGMKFGLNEYARTFPDRPSNYGDASVLGDMSLNEREAFILGRALQRCAEDVKRRSIVKADNLTSKRNYIRFNKLRRSHDSRF